MSMLTELADDLAYGIGALRVRNERNRALEELRALNAELSSTSGAESTRAVGMVHGASR